MGMFFAGGPALDLGLPRAPGGLPCGQSEAGLCRLERTCSHAAAREFLRVSHREEDGTRSGRTWHLPDHAEHLTGSLFPRNISGGR